MGYSAVNLEWGVKKATFIDRLGYRPHDGWHKKYGPANTSWKGVTGKDVGATCNKLLCVKLIKEVVSSSAVDCTIENLEDPPGRRPDKLLVDRSEWYKSLSEKDQEMMRNILIEAVDESIFGFLCVLDDVRSISNQGDTNNLTLSHGKTLLNDNDDESLHGIYNNV